MRALICVDGRSWEPVVRGASRYLSDGEVVLVHVVDERVPRGYDMSVRGLLGRRERHSAQRVGASSEAAARDLLADAEALLKRLRQDLSVVTLTLVGPPNEGLLRAARERAVEAIFVGRGVSGSRVAAVSGTMTGWKLNRHGNPDGLYLDGSLEVRFPPHSAAGVQRVAREGAEVEVRGAWRGGHLHAHTIADPVLGERAEAHRPPPEGRDERPLGHTARFIADHAACDVVVLAT